MNNTNRTQKQVVEPCSRRAVTEVVGETSLESSLFIYGLHMDVIKENTLKDIIARLEDFRFKSSNKVSQMLTAHAQKDHNAIEGLAGKLADLCSQMGAVSMLRLCYQIQMGARDGAELSPLINRLKLEHKNYNQNIADAS